MKVKEILETAKEAHSHVLLIIKDHPELFPMSEPDLRRQLDVHYLYLELVWEYGIDIRKSYVHSTDWFKESDHVTFGRYGGKYNRTISWSSDGRQPEDEFLMNISFSTGPYIFGEDYPQEFFQRFFQELLSLDPDYTDLANKSLYWKIENASAAYKAFPEILKKYGELNKEDIKQRRIAKLEADLQKLKQS